MTETQAQLMPTTRSEEIGTFVDRKRSPRTKPPAASTATLVSERAPLEYPFRRLALCPLCQAATLVDPEAERPQVNSMTRPPAVEERASPPQLMRNPPLPRQAVDRAAAASAPRRTPRPKRHRPRPQALPPGRLLHLLPTERPRPRLRGLARSRATHLSDLLPGLAKPDLLLRSIDLRETLRGWQRCTSLTLVFHLISRCSRPSRKRCSRNSGRRKAEHPLHTTATLLR